MSQESLSKAEDLKKAFHSFEQISDQLNGVYQHLEQQVDVLNHQLAMSQEERERQLMEKDRLAHRLASLLDALPGGVVVLDGRGIVQECNPVAIELLGQPLQGELWREVVERSFAPRWDDGHDVSLVNGSCVNISTQSLEHEPGQILLLKDVTETRRLQEQLDSLKRLSAKGEMAAALAHQIRTPLSTALLYASTLCNEDQNRDRQKKHATRLVSRLRHLEKLIEEMLLFARGGQCLEAQSVDLAELLSELQQQSQPLLSDSHYLIHYPADPARVQIRANRDALLSAMMNLLTNAIQASDGQGELEIKLLLSEAMLLISFTDNGPGIPAGIRHDLFEPFVSTRSHGTGLGLAVVHSVITAHGGGIRLDETYQQGARFIINLPLDIAEAEDSQKPSETQTGDPQ